MSERKLKQKMDWLFQKIGTFKYVILILVVGILLMIVPTGEKGPASEDEQAHEEPSEDISLLLEDIIRHIDGAGDARVLLSMECGPVNKYQTNTETQNSENGEHHISDTVLVSSGSGTEDALVISVTYPTYRGAIVICEGADKASVRLDVIEAVSSLTGLSSDKIAVIKMSSD